MLWAEGKLEGVGEVSEGRQWTKRATGRGRNNQGKRKEAAYNHSTFFISAFQLKCF